MTKRELSLGLGVPLSLDFKDAPHDAMTLITVSNGESEKSVLVSPRGMVAIDADNYLKAPKERLRPKHAGKKEVGKAALKGASWFFAAILLTFVSLTATGIMKAQVILTGSMEPTLSPGDVVLEFTPAHKEPKVGDIATYLGKRMDGSVVGTFTHRIIGQDEKLNYIFQGDANPTPDTQHPTIKEIVGVALFSIPKIGMLLSPKMLMMLLLAGFGIWLIVDALRNED
jgi:signal peptidase I